MTDSSLIQVLSVDDHPLLREGIAAIINSQPDMVTTDTAASGKEALELIRRNMPDVVLLDLQLPDLNGLDVLIAIRSEFPTVRVVMLTTFERTTEVQRALKAGARGYLLKSSPAEQIIDTIRQVHAGKMFIPPDIAAGVAEHLTDQSLSDREVEVLRHVAAGRKNRDIAKKLFIAEETVKVHLRHIMSKLGASDRTQSVTIAARRGIIYL